METTISLLAEIDQQQHQDGGLDSQVVPRVRMLHKKPWIVPSGSDVLLLISFDTSI